MLINNGEYDLNPGNTTIVSFNNDILDGIYMDAPENYAFISAHTAGYLALLNCLDDEGIKSVDIPEIDEDVEPTCYIIMAVSKLMVEDLEEMLESF